MLITGASSGIGRATAHELAGRGARLVLVARGREALETTAAEARAAGAGEVLVFPADVTDEDGFRTAVDTALERFGAARQRRPRRPGDGLRHDRGTAARRLRGRREHGPPRHGRRGQGGAARLPEAGGRPPAGRELAAGLRGHAAHGQLRRGEVGPAGPGAGAPAGDPGRAGHQGLRGPARGRGHPDLLPGGVLDRQHRPAAPAGVLARSGWRGRCSQRWTGRAGWCRPVS